jgi:hypothetical protein
VGLLKAIFGSCPSSTPTPKDGALQAEGSSYAMRRARNSATSIVRIRPDAKAFIRRSCATKARDTSHQYIELLAGTRCGRG